MKKYMSAFVITALMAAAALGTAYADSMLSSNPMESADGLIIIGENSCDRFAPEDGNGDVLCVTLKKKMNRIWGPDVVRKKMASSDRLDFDLPPNLPKIMVAVKSKITTQSSKSYKYKHKYSSRHKGKRSRKRYEVVYIDIAPVIIREARRHNISPVLLKAVLHTESNFKNYAVSRAGAMGLGQLMPGTARYLGVKDPFSPHQNIRGAAKYLSMLKKNFKSLDLVLAAYNAGPGTVSRSGGVPNIYETRRYIVKVKRNMHWGLK